MMIKKLKCFFNPDSYRLSAFPNLSKSIMSSTNLYAVLVFEDDGVELYPKLYKSYEAAREAALEKYKEILDEERSECAEWGGSMASQVDVEENKETGTTKLYIEKEIYITIQRYEM